MIDFRELFKIISESNIRPANLQLFLVGDGTFFRYYRGRMSTHLFEEFVSTAFSQDRGRLLDKFATLEFLLSELIRITLIGIHSDKTLLMNKLLAKLGYREKIDLLHDWKIIDSNQKDRLASLITVRNNLAHKFDISEMEYKGKPLQRNVNVLAKDMNDTWNELVTIYRNSQDDKEIEKILEELKQLNNQART
ncbi:MAG TPA: hypothetical protein VD699_06890 [Nitrosopumilaceae archaeon]|nr:hypothetical protein [Nitrosopumilaceae archaeon]